MVASKESEVLTIDVEDLKMIKNQFDKHRKKLLEFMMSTFPYLDNVKSKDLRESYTYVVEEREYNYNNHIVVEEEDGDNIFVLYDGKCEIYRNVYIEDVVEGYYSPQVEQIYKLNPLKCKKITICEIFPGTFLGEEIMFNESRRYEYSVKVTSANAKVLVINKKKFSLRFPKDVFLGVAEIYKQKKENYQSLLMASLEKKNIIIKELDLSTTLYGKIHKKKNLKLSHMRPRAPDTSSTTIVNRTLSPVHSLERSSIGRKSRDIQIESNQSSKASVFRENDKPLLLFNDDKRDEQADSEELNFKKKAVALSRMTFIPLPKPKPKRYIPPCEKDSLSVHFKAIRRQEKVIPFTWNELYQNLQEKKNLLLKDQAIQDKEKYIAEDRKSVV